MDIIISAEKAGDLVATVERDPYQEALAIWLQGKPDNTRLSYAAALRDFLATTAEQSPDAFGPIVWGLSPQENVFLIDGIAARTVIELLQGESHG